MRQNANSIYSLLSSSNPRIIIAAAASAVLSRSGIPFFLSPSRLMLSLAHRRRGATLLLAASNGVIFEQEVVLKPKRTVMCLFPEGGVDATEVVDAADNEEVGKRGSRKPAGSRGRGGEGTVP